MKAASYDAIVIATGQSGRYVISRLAAAGMKIAVIERKVFASPLAPRSTASRSVRYVST